MIYLIHLIMRMRSHSARTAGTAMLYGAAACAGMSGCTREVRATEGKDIPHSADSERVLDSSEARILWRRRPAAGSAWARPTRVIADDHAVYILDGNVASLTALGTQSGQELWTWRGGAAGGADTSRLERPVGLTLDAKGNTVVSDVQLRALFVVDGKGRLVRRVNVFAPVYAMCPVGQELLLQTWATENPMWTIDAAGEVTSRTALPWPALLKAMPAETGASLSSSASGAQCVLALTSGRGYVIWTAGKGFDAPRDYAQLPGTPAKGGQIRATAAMLDDSTVTVATAGGGPGRNRWLDVYEKGTGRYVRTAQMPAPFVSVTRSGERYYGITFGDTAREVVAFRFVRRANSRR